MRSIEAAQKSWIALYDKYADGKLEREFFLNEKKQYDADMEKMEEELAALRQVQEEEETQQEGSQRKADQAMAFLEEEELTEDMKEKLIEKVIVYPGNRIEIGDIDCHENTGVTISYKLRNAKEGQEKKTPILRVEEYEPAKNFFEQLGFTRSSTQENIRTKIYVTFENIKYMVRFDVWPEIEEVTFVTVEEVTPTDPRSKEAFIKQLNLTKYDISKGAMVDIDNVYKEKLGFRASDIPELRFDFDLHEQSIENINGNNDKDKMNLLYLWLNDELKDGEKLYFAFKKSSKSIESVLDFLEKND